MNPLVTFSLLTYNQESYVREAIEAILSQDYSPLQIIISDDNSSDNTYSIIKEYESCKVGDRKVIVRKNDLNYGTMLHLAEVVSLAEGELLVLAAGDDISKANRVSVLVDAWKKTSAWGLCSRYDLIDSMGKILEANVKAKVLESKKFKSFFYDNEGDVYLVHGCTSAYDMRLFEYLKLEPEDYILAEDGTLSVLLNLIGKNIVNIDESLVLYRQSDRSLTNSVEGALTLSQAIEDEDRIEIFARSQGNRSRLFLRMNMYLGPQRKRNLNVIEISAELERQYFRASWSSSNIKKRLSYFFKNTNETWILPRLLGRSIFFKTKVLYRSLKMSLVKIKKSME